MKKAAGETPLRPFGGASAAVALLIGALALGVLVLIGVLVAVLVLVVLLIHEVASLNGCPMTGAVMMP